MAQETAHDPSGITFHNGENGNRSTILCYILLVLCMSPGFWAHTSQVLPGAPSPGPIPGGAPCEGRKDFAGQFCGADSMLQTRYGGRGAGLELIQLAKLPPHICNMYLNNVRKGGLFPLTKPHPCERTEVCKGCTMLMPRALLFIATCTNRQNPLHIYLFYVLHILACTNRHDHLIYTCSISLYMQACFDLIYSSYNRY